MHCVKGTGKKPGLLSSFLMAGLTFAVILALGAGCTEKPLVKVGMAEKVITPKPGMPMAGYRRAAVSTGAHDDLWARSLVIEDKNGTGIVLMTLGLVNLNESYMDQIREGVNKATSIPVSNIVISCTHTHSGPAVGGPDDEYTKSLIENCIASAVEAWNNRIPGRVGFGSTVELELGRNDRKMEYGGLHPDPEVGIIKVENAKGGLIGVAFNYGCHPSTLDLHNLEFTEDWPFYSISGIKEQLGKKDLWVAYYQSAQGNVKVGYTAELSAVGADMAIRNFWYAEHKGNMMTWTVLEALGEIQTSGDFTIDTASGYYEFPIRDSYPYTLKEAQKIHDDAKAKLAEMEKLSDKIGKRVLDKYRVDEFVADYQLGCAKWLDANPNSAPVKMLMQAVRINDTVFATFPVEVYAEIGLAVKQQSKYDKTFIIGIASGHGGYMPTKEEYLEGGYSAVMTRYSPKCEDIIIQSASELIGQVTDQ